MKGSLAYYANFDVIHLIELTLTPPPPPNMYVPKNEENVDTNIYNSSMN